MIFLGSFNQKDNIINEFVIPNQIKGLSYVFYSQQ